MLHQSLQIGCVWKSIVTNSVKYYVSTYVPESELQSEMLVNMSLGIAWLMSREHIGHRIK